MASTPSKILLTDLKDEENSTEYSFEEGWTIRQLREHVAEEEGEEPEEIRIFHAAFELDDNELVKDFAGKEEGNFVKYRTFANFISDEEILVWRGRNLSGIHRWYMLDKNSTTTLDLGKKRHITNGFMAKFAIAKKLK